MFEKKLFERLDTMLAANQPVTEASVEVGGRYKVDYHFFMTYPRQEVVRIRLSLHRGQGTVEVVDIKGDMAYVVGDRKDTSMVGIAQVPIKFLRPDDGELSYAVPQVSNAAGRPIGAGPTNQ